MPSRSFTSDNTAGASPEVLAAVTEAATDHAQPYGNDPWTERATALLSEVFEREVDVVVTSTGSAANSLALAALTPPWGSVLCHVDSHINNDECGAPEFYTNGAKLIPLSEASAKLDPTHVADAARRKVGDVHSTQPSVLSLTQATEAGSVYTIDEITALAHIAGAAGLAVHMDGARFANAVAALGCSPADMTWRAGVDVLTFGATKNGAMTADAIVVFDRDLTDQLRYRTKRAGQLTSKMRFQSAQLLGYLQDGLWMKNARHANEMSRSLHVRLADIGVVRQVGAPDGNIVFAELPQSLIDGLLDDGFTFYSDRWAPEVCRFVTSFATHATDIDDLIGRIQAHVSASSAVASP